MEGLLVSSFGLTFTFEPSNPKPITLLVQGGLCDEDVASCVDLWTSLRNLFPSEQRGGDTLKGLVLADAVHCEVSVTLVRLDYRPLSLCHL